VHSGGVPDSRPPPQLSTGQNGQLRVGNPTVSQAPSWRVDSREVYPFAVDAKTAQSV
jgi:hypothetical protein